jgi:hypothetical protein
MGRPRDDLQGRYEVGGATIDLTDFRGASGFSIVARTSPSARSSSSPSVSTVPTTGSSGSWGAMLEVVEQVALEA